MSREFNLTTVPKEVALPVLARRKHEFYESAIMNFLMAEALSVQEATDDEEEQQRVAKIADCRHTAGNAQMAAERITEILKGLVNGDN